MQRSDDTPFDRRAQLTARDLDGMERDDLQHLCERLLALLRVPDTPAIHLTGTERGMLEALLNCAGRVLTKEQLLAARPTSCDPFAEPKLVDAIICKLRKRLAEHGLEGVVRTVWGRGYTINAADAPRIRAVVWGGEGEAGE